MSRKTVSFKDGPDDLGVFIDKLERQSTGASGDTPLPMLKRELTSLGNPWDVSSPALRQLCNVIPRKRESFGGSLKVLKGNINLRRSYSVLKSKSDFPPHPSPQRLNIYPVLSQITPSFIPGGSPRPESQPEDSPQETPRDIQTTANRDIFAHNQVFGIRESPAGSKLSEKKVFGMESLSAKNV